MGIWWKRANKAGAVAGMIVGLGVTTFYMIAAVLRLAVVRHAHHRFGDLRAAGGIPHHLDRLAADRASTQVRPGPRGGDSLSQVRQATSRAAQGIGLGQH
jgi:hypothetical protein